MNVKSQVLAFAASSFLCAGVANAGSKYCDTIDVFKNIPARALPSSSAATLCGISECRREFRARPRSAKVMSVQGFLVGETVMKQVSGGFQAAGKVYSQMMFVKDQRALEKSSFGHFEFSASAVPILAGVGASRHQRRIPPGEYHRT